MKNPFASLMLTKRQIRRTFVYKVFGRGIFAPDLWRFERDSVAAGLSMGLFIAFTPTIPFQMIMAAFGAIYFRANLPVALAACWVTNPLTLVPIYSAAFRIGRRIMTNLPWVEGILALVFKGGRFNHFLRLATAFTIGGIILGALAGLAGGLLVRILWQDRKNDDKKPAEKKELAAKNKKLSQSKALTSK